MPPPSPALRLSVLDLAPVPKGSSVGDALRASIELARLADRLGFHRYWVAEHHNMPGIASSSPAVLLAHLSMATERIRLGFAQSSIETAGGPVRGTVSIGVAMAQHSGFDLEVLLASADAALYEAKARGRNVTVTAGLAAIQRPELIVAPPAEIRKRIA